MPPGSCPDEPNEGDKGREQKQDTTGNPGAGQGSLRRSGIKMQLSWSMLTSQSTAESNNAGQRSTRAGPRGPGEPTAPGQSSEGKPLVLPSMETIFPDGSGTTCDEKIGSGI